MGLAQKPFIEEQEHIGRPITNKLLGAAEDIPFLGSKVVKPLRPQLQFIGENVLVPSNVIGPIEMFKIVRGMGAIHQISLTSRTARYAGIEHLPGLAKNIPRFATRGGEEGVAGLGTPHMGVTVGDFREIEATGKYTSASNFIQGTDAKWRYLYRIKNPQHLKILDVSTKDGMSILARAKEHVAVKPRSEFIGDRSVPGYGMATEGWKSSDLRKYLMELGYDGTLHGGTSGTSVWEKTASTGTRVEHTALPRTEGIERIARKKGGAQKKYTVKRNQPFGDSLTGEFLLFDPQKHLEVVGMVPQRHTEREVLNNTIKEFLKTGYVPNEYTYIDPHVNKLDWPYETPDKEKWFPKQGTKKLEPLGVPSDSPVRNKIRALLDNAGYGTSGGITDADIDKMVSRIEFMEPLKFALEAKDAELLDAMVWAGSNPQRIKLFEKMWHSNATSTQLQEAMSDPAAYLKRNDPDAYEEFMGKKLNEEAFKPVEGETGYLTWEQAQAQEGLEVMPKTPASEKLNNLLKAIFASPDAPKQLREREIPDAELDFVTLGTKTKIPKISGLAVLETGRSFRGNTVVGDSVILVPDPQKKAGAIRLKLWNPDELGYSRRLAAEEAAIPEGKVIAELDIEGESGGVKTALSVIDFVASMRKMNPDIYFMSTLANPKLAEFISKHLGFKKLPNSERWVLRPEDELIPRTGGFLASIYDKLDPKKKKQVDDLAFGGNEPDVPEMEIPADENVRRGHLYASNSLGPRKGGNWDIGREKNPFPDYEPYEPADIEFESPEIAERLKSATLDRMTKRFEPDAASEVELAHEIWRLDSQMAMIAESGNIELLHQLADYTRYLNSLYHKRFPNGDEVFSMEDLERRLVVLEKRGAKGITPTFSRGEYIVDEG